MAKLFDKIRILQDVPDIVAKTFGDLPAIKFGAAAAGVCFATLFPTPKAAEAGVFAFALLITDTVTAIAAAWRRREPIESTKLRAFGAKLVGYSAVILLAIAVARFMPGASNLFGGGDRGSTKLQESASLAVSCWIMATEGISILENVKKMGIKHLPPGLAHFLESRIGKKEPGAAG